ncbi:MAG: hypothetical protein IJS47_01525 [Clostridia bacterium]|nr:hypothetical protein [Clostridia bacterium]
MKKQILAIASIIVLFIVASILLRPIDEVDIPLENVKTLIDSYFERDDVDKTNFVYNYVDEEEHCVVVGLKDIKKEKQDEFIHDVFSSSAGSIYIKNLQSKALIKFELSN